MERKTKKQASTEFQGVSGLTKIREIDIDELCFDDRNANRGTELGKELIHNSISKNGVGRGVLVDRHLKLIAGNHAVKEMKAQGIDRVIVVPTDGKTLVVTQRVDIDKDSRAGHELALSDNRASEANLNFDPDLIRDLEAEFDLDLLDMGINLNEGGPYFPGDEEPDGAEAMETSYGEKDNSKYSGGEGIEEKGFEQSFFPLSIALTKAERLAFDAFKKSKKLHTDTEGFQFMFQLCKNG